MTKHVENYDKPDPFSYRLSSDDWLRRGIVRDILSPEGCVVYQRALDLGAGEGFVTENLPAAAIWGYDVSEKAMSRFPAGSVLRFDPVIHAKPFDLICAMGVLYPFYETQNLLDMMVKFKHAQTHFLIAGIPDWEENIDGTMSALGVKRVKTVDIKPYRQYDCQRIRLYKP